ncbi:CAP domain-containing protein [Nocardia sp. CDC159]|uniref:CAP domain-containing protein n=1 Tax=Nocardia pulmonis TaxID=2951408 RepID=A0A9X2E959_9NOCA|nr:MULTISPECIES: CAP domain-containing protein [Nocardia]MCM6776432.1 CAP domain-containing protein [Nocardia pulmonis]MCM6788856.1 CAP domain-containing protein [Nocardia sp. CDC159]
MRSSSAFDRSLSYSVGLMAFVACVILSAPPAAAAPQARSVADRVVTLTNAERAKAGCDPLRAEPRLTRAAQAHAEDMAAKGFLSHNSSRGGPGDRIRAAGYRARMWAENIAAGQSGPSEVVAAWMRSAGHRANILNCRLRDIGVGSAPGRNGTPYWVQNFATSR